MSKSEISADTIEHVLNMQIEEAEKWKYGSPNKVGYDEGASHKTSYIAGLRKAIQIINKLLRDNEE